MIYLDNAATTYPKPKRVYKRVEEIIKNIGGNPGRSSHTMALEASRVIFSTREALAKLLNIPDASRIAFTKNATEAVNIALKGLLRSGDHVVTTSFEHNSVARTFKRLEAEGIEVTKVSGGRGKSPDRVEPGDIEKALTGKTKLVCIVHASNVFGTIEPVPEIGELCRGKGITFMVDGAQTAGAVPIDMDSMNIDLFAGTGHKALLGPQGTGFIYMKEGIEPPPLVDGGTGELTDVLEIPDRLETGTINTPGIGGLGAGVEFILNEGLTKIKAYEEKLLGQLIQGLGKIKGVNILGTPDAKQRVGLVSFTIEGQNPDEIGMRLDREFSIMVRAGTHCAPDAHMTAGTHPEGAVRVSPGYFNEPEEIEEFIKAVEFIAKGS